MSEKNFGNASSQPDIFVVDIKMQKNSTWQGSLRRLGEDDQVSFRSALEMLKVMDAAMGEDEEDAPSFVD
ncbi:hypothetical protein LJB76_00605 [Clostridia bacterium OttesenSCG-928-O13]|nr:hypothetical protein [Clostridia bacterium OttesenSCG-928-O13]